MNSTGDQDIRAVSGRLPHMLGVLAYMHTLLNQLIYFQCHYILYFLLTSNALCFF